MSRHLPVNGLQSASGCRERGILVVDEPPLLAIFSGNESPDSTARIGSKNLALLGSKPSVSFSGFEVPRSVS